MKKISILHFKDNVGTVTTKIQSGETIDFDMNGEKVVLGIVEDIPLGHKVALKDFDKDESIIKYGEVIGKTNQQIKKGSLVHIQNVESLRGRGDLTKEAQKSC
jgi:altronate dehydratase small subunit